MLQSRQFSNAYINKMPIDASKHQMPSFTLPVNSFEKVNEMIESGISNGGFEPVSSFTADFMFLRSIEDPDGYMWGIMHLDLPKFESVKKANA